MDMGRVREIVQSDQNINVMYEGEAIWIDNYDETKNTVSFHLIRTGKSQIDDARRLHEQ